MADTAWTAGPWGHPVWDAHSAKVLVSLTGQPFDCWASPGGSVFRERDLANGHLIAAAPALYASLACFLEDERFQVAVGGNPNVVDAMLANARAALAAAKGQS